VSGARTPEAAVEVVAIGTELLLGETMDGNGAWLGRRLAAEGIRVVGRSVVPDDEAAIGDAVAVALARTGTVLCSGGLGPTRDDRTRAAVAGLFRRRLVVDDAWLEVVRERFARRGLVMAPSNRAQAEIPEGAVLWPNARGTAPGIRVEDARGAVVLLPGVPHELRALVEDHVVPWLRERFPLRPGPVASRVVRTTGIAESALGERLDDLLPQLAPLTVAFLPSLDGTDLRITSWGSLSSREAEAALDAAEARLRERLGILVYATGDTGLAAVVGATLAARGMTLGLAESCTGGLISARLTHAPGASTWFLAGYVTYSNDAKQRDVGVPADLLSAHGAVSAEVASAMAEGARRATGADCGLAVTGVAGPAGGTEAKPVGTVYIAAAVGSEVAVRLLRLGGDRFEIRHRSAQAALDLLRRRLLEAAG
jgi:nicotinamide-nucleotide amidase